MNSRFCFTQSSAPIAAPALAESYRLRCMEGEPEFAQLWTTPDHRSEGLTYQLELASDTGPVAVPYTALMLVAFDVPPNRQAEVEAWYDEEHVGLLMRAKGWLRTRRFRVNNWRGKRWTSLAFHELRDISALQSPERKIARSTSWRAQLEKEAWFQQAGRWVYRPTQ